MARKLLKYLVEDTDRHGNVRVYYRKPGQKKVRLWVSQEHPDFLKHWDAARHGEPFPKPTKACPPRETAGTLSALVSEYSQSARYRKLAPVGQRTVLSILRQCCAEPLKPGSKDTMGDVPLPLFGPGHVKIIRDRKAGLPGAANNRIKYLRALFSWKQEGEPMVANPAASIRFLPPVNKDGHHAWTLKEVAAFEATHAIGTTARLAFDLAVYTAARRSDIVRFGPGNVGEDGWLTFVQSKTKGEVEIPIIEPLVDSIASSRTGKTFLLTAFGKPYTANGFGNAFRAWCDEAGLPQCAIHGLRKASAARLAELGCSEEEIQAITGHATGKEVSRYTKSARRRLMAASAMEKLRNSLPKKVGQTAEKPP